MDTLNYLYVVIIVWLKRITLPLANGYHIFQAFQTLDIDNTRRKRKRILYIWCVWIAFLDLLLPRTTNDTNFRAKKVIRKCAAHAEI